MRLKLQAFVEEEGQAFRLELSGVSFLPIIKNQFI
jgi:hypothetical protein